MIRFLSVLAAGLLFSAYAIAQQPDTIWSLRVDSVQVRGATPARSDGVSVGARVTTFSESVLESYRAGSLSELLANNSTVYIKSLGQGAMSTVSFRGTASSHTKVTWNGISLNPSMSNTFDFSQVPVFFTDDLTLYHGGGHLRNGTGALGGTVNISNSADWRDTTTFRFFGEAGSFDTYTGAASFRVLREKALYRTRVYYRKSENNYKYLNKVLRLEPFYERRKQAAYDQVGVMQEAYFRPDDHSTVSTGLWLMTGERELPQPIIVNVTQNETYRNTSLNYYINYNRKKGRHDLALNAGYLFNRMDHRRWYDNYDFGTKKNDNRMQGVQIKADYSYIPSDKFEFGASARYSYDKARTNSTDSVTLGNGTKIPGWNIDRNTGSLGGYLRWMPLQGIALDVQGMGEWNDGDVAPTFSAGLAGSLVPGRLKAKASVAYNYKYPSLNDMYWIPGGNPDLSPEKGFSYDVTLTYTTKIGERFYLKTDLSVYRMDIENWIMWLPQAGSSVWRPVNYNEVLSRGVEARVDVNGEFRRWKIGLTAHYTYSSSEYQNENFENDRAVDKQLPYIPLHQTNARLSAEWNHIRFVYHVVYTGKRYTTMDESYETPAFTFHGAELSYKWRLGDKYLLTPKFSVDNLFDAYYESTQYYPMPLRSFLFSLSLSF